MLCVRSSLGDTLISAEHEFMCHGAPPDLQAPLYGAHEPVRIFSGVLSLQSVEQLPTRQGWIGVEPGLQIIRHCDERVGAAPAALSLPRAGAAA